MVKAITVAPAVPHRTGHWRLLYYDAPTRGEQIRLLFFLASTPFDDVRLHPFPEGLDPYRKAALGDASPLLGTDLCPAVTAPDGTHCVETADIMKFVGERVGLAPEAPGSQVKAVELTLLAQSLLDGCFYARLKSECVRLIAKKEWYVGWVLRPLMAPTAEDEAPRAKLAAALPTLEAALEAAGGAQPFLCGASLTYADAAVFNVLYECFEYTCFDEKDLLADKPRLRAYLTEMRARCAGHFERRATEHQCGFKSAAAFLAATNTPFPWSRVVKKRE